MPREVEVGILYNRYESTAKRLKEELEALGVSAHLNAPYSGFEDGVYSIERHGQAANLPYLELEIRQDLIREQGWSRALGCFTERSSIGGPLHRHLSC